MFANVFKDEQPRDITTELFYAITMLLLITLIIVRFCYYTCNIILALLYLLYYTCIIILALLYLHYYTCIIILALLVHYLQSCTLYYLIFYNVPTTVTCQARWTPDLPPAKSGPGYGNELFSRRNE